MKTGDHAIGLFQGMFEKNILSFNRGWDSNAQKLANFRQGDGMTRCGRRRGDGKGAMGR